MHQGGVGTRRQAYEMGVTRHMIRHQVRAGRWRLIGEQSIELCGVVITAEGRWRLPRLGLPLTG